MFRAEISFTLTERKAVLSLPGHGFLGNLVTYVRQKHGNGLECCSWLESEELDGWEVVTFVWLEKIINEWTRRKYSIVGHSWTSKTWGPELGGNWFFNWMNFIYYLQQISQNFTAKCGRGRSFALVSSRSIAELQTRMSAAISFLSGATRHYLSQKGGLKFWDKQEVLQIKAAGGACIWQGAFCKKWRTNLNGYLLHIFRRIKLSERVKALANISHIGPKMKVPFTKHAQMRSIQNPAHKCVLLSITHVLSSCTK